MFLALDSPAVERKSSQGSTLGAAMRVWALSTVKSSGPIKGLSSSHARGMETAAPTRARVGLAVQAREMPSTAKLFPRSFEMPLGVSSVGILHRAHVPRSQMITLPAIVPLGNRPSNPFYSIGWSHQHPFFDGKTQSGGEPGESSEVGVCRRLVLRESGGLWAVACTSVQMRNDLRV
jgi:hypothetical protein